MNFMRFFLFRLFPLIFKALPKALVFGFFGPSGSGASTGTSGRLMIFAGIPFLPFRIDFAMTTGFPSVLSLCRTQGSAFRVQLLFLLQFQRRFPVMVPLETALAPQTVPEPFPEPFSCSVSGSRGFPVQEFQAILRLAEGILCFLSRLL